LRAAALIAALEASCAAPEPQSWEGPAARRLVGRLNLYDD